MGEMEGSVLFNGVGVDRIGVLPLPTPTQTRTQAQTLPMPLLPIVLRGLLSIFVCLSPIVSATCSISYRGGGHEILTNPLPLSNKAGLSLFVKKESEHVYLLAFTWCHVL